MVNTNELIGFSTALIPNPYVRRRPKEEINQATKTTKQARCVKVSLMPAAANFGNLRCHVAAWKR